MTETEDRTGAYLPVPQQQVPGGMPAPRDLKRALVEALGRYIAEERERVGEIHLPEDVFPLVRGIVASKEKLDEYAAAFREAAKVCDQELEYAAQDAVGEHDGIPSNNFVVPDVEGDISVSRKIASEYAFDLDGIVAAYAADFAEQNGQDAACYAQCIAGFLELGRFTLQVSKVKAYAQGLSRVHADDLASMFTSAIRRTQTYNGVKPERKKPT